MNLCHLFADQYLTTHWKKLKGICCEQNGDVSYWQFDLCVCFTMKIEKDDIWIKDGNNFLNISVKWKKKCYITKTRTTDESNSISNQLVNVDISESQPPSEHDGKLNADETVEETDEKYSNSNKKVEKKKRQLMSKSDRLRKEEPPKKQQKSEKKPNTSVRFDYSLGHFPSIDKSKQVRCKNAKCDKKTFVFCSICNVHLCLCVQENRNCFADFHIKIKNQTSWIFRKILTNQLSAFIYNKCSSISFLQQKLEWITNFCKPKNSRNAVKQVTFVYDLSWQLKQYLKFIQL